MVKTVLVTGAGGYVGAVLTPRLLERGYRVKALDLFIYGRNVLEAVKDDPKLMIVAGISAIRSCCGASCPAATPSFIWLVFRTIRVSS